MTTSGTAGPVATVVGVAGPVTTMLPPAATGTTAPVPVVAPVVPVMVTSPPGVTVEVGGVTVGVVGMVAPEYTLVLNPNRVPNDSAISDTVALLDANMVACCAASSLAPALRRISCTCTGSIPCWMRLAASCASIL